MLQSIVTDQKWPAPFGRCVFWAIYGAFFTVLALIIGPLVVAPASGAYTWHWIYKAWKRRPPRKRKPATAGGRVRNLGHRLVTE
jgi:hypothetical protein